MIKVRMTLEDAYDLELHQASILKCKLLKQKYSYRKQMDRIYKFHGFAPNESARRIISSLKFKIEEINEVLSGVAQPDINFN